MTDLRFPKSHRILRRVDIRAVYDQGTPYRNAGFHLFVMPHKQTGPTRIGLTTTRTLGNAVVRNRLRRWARETYRMHYSNLETGWDLVLNYHRQLAEVDRKEFDRLFIDVLKKSKVLHPDGA